MPKPSDDIQTEIYPSASVQKIFSILSDAGCVKILDMVYEHRQPKIRDLGTRKHYYDRIAKLTKAHLITKKKRNGKQQLQQQQQKQQQKTPANKFGYELTDLGVSVYGILRILRRAQDLRMNLEAIDALDESMPHEELNKLIEKLIPDESIRKILLKDRLRLIRLNIHHTPF
jgi:Fe2+ or Zn2+ uptake regulation protein